MRAQTAIQEKKNRHLLKTALVIPFLIWGILKWPERDAWLSQNSGIGAGNKKSSEIESLLSVAPAFRKKFPEGDHHPAAPDMIPPVFSGRMDSTKPVVTSHASQTITLKTEALLQRTAVDQLPVQRFAFEQGEDASRKTAVSNNPAHGFRTEINSEGKTAIYPAAAEPGKLGGCVVSWQLKSVTARRREVSEQIRTMIPPHTLKWAAENASLDREGITEWLRQSAKGLEHGFTLTANPLGEQGKGWSFRLNLEFSTTLQARLAKNNVLAFYDSSGSEKYRYEHLVVTDARGMTVPAVMELTSTGPDTESAVDLALVIQDHQAVYPLKVDPTFTASTVRNLNWHQASSSNPRFLTRMGNYVYFAAQDPAYGTNLWKSDGTAPGTRILRLAGKDPQNLAVAGGRIYFTAYTAAAGRELWTSDGTVEGSLMLKDIAQGSENADISSLMAVGEKMFFLVDGRILWATDGTPAGTVLVKSIGPRFSAFAEYLTAWNGALYFTAMDGSSGQEIWRSDGTSAGTQILKDITPGNASSGAANLTVAGSSLFFTVRREGGQELWKTDGSIAGTVPVKFMGAALENLTAAGSALFFSAAAEGGLETGQSDLWTSDGTEEGTVRLKTIRSNGNPGDLRYFKAAGGGLYFYANDPAGLHGVGLWKSNGTELGTIKLKSFTPAYGVHDFMADLNGTLYFRMADEESGMELWRSDGTSEGTVMVRKTGTDGMGGNLTVLGDSLLFTAVDGRGGELWRSDGTTDGTVLVKDIYGGITGEGSYQALIPMGDSVYFPMYDASTGNELWRSDGTAAGTRIVKDAVPGQGSLFPSSLTAVGGALFFDGYNSGLWRTDGTAEGTTLLLPSVRLSGLTAMGGKLYFSAYQYDWADELWRSDGTPEGTVMVRDINPGSGSFPRGMIADGDRLYFFANNGQTGHELWKSNGTGTGTVLVKDVNDYIQFEVMGYYLTAVRGKVYFPARTDAAGWELWGSDGTAAGTSMVINLTPGIGDSWPSQLLEMEGMLYFLAGDGVKYGLWESNGTAVGTSFLKEVSGSGYSGRPGILATVGKALYFTTASIPTGEELWKTDGTAEGTVMIKDIFPGPENSNIQVLGQHDGILYFAATDDSHGRELWRTDGTESGTCMVEDTVPGIGSSCPLYMAVAGGTIFYKVQDDGSGVGALRALRNSPLPAVGLGSVTGISRTGAVLNGQVLPQGSPGTASFFYGPSNTTMDHTPAVLFAGPETSPVQLSSPLSGLLPGTLYDYFLVAGSDTAGNSVSGSFRTAPNSAPVITVMQVELESDGTGKIETAAMASDPDDPGRLSFSMGAVKGVKTSDAGGDQWTFRPDETWTGSGSLTFIATDPFGASVTGTILISDITAPSFASQEDITTEATSNEGAVVSFTPSATDGVGITRLTSVPAAGSLFPVGKTPVTVTAEDAAGNSAMLRFYVTVTPPSASERLQILAPSFSVSRIFSFSWASADGKAYKVERSSDLRLWETVESIQSSGGPVTTYASPPLPPDAPRYFYRVREL